MPKYTCERCLKDFKQKSHFDKHKKNKKPCQNNKGKIEEVVENFIINKKLITNDIISNSDIEMSKYIEDLIKKNNCIVDDINQLFHNEGIEFTKRLELVTSIINYIFRGLELTNEIDIPLKNKLIDILKKTTLDKNELIQKVFMFYGNKTLKVELDQFYTPITIGRFIIDLCIPEKKIIDPACGTGDLIVNYSGNITLWDVSQDVIKICELNYKLNAKKYEAICINSIKSYDMGNNVYDYCCLNPPFGSSTVVTDTDLLNKYELGRNKSKEEIGILFIERAINLLKYNGIAFIIVPNGYLGNSSKNTKQLRKYLLSFRIISIIELPNNTFSRSGTGVSTSMIIIQKRKMTNPYNIFIKKIINIGYVLNKKNTPFKYKTNNGNYILKDGNPILYNDLEDCFNELKYFNKNEKISNISDNYCYDNRVLDIDIINTNKLDKDILDINRYLSIYTNTVSNYLSLNCCNIEKYIIPNVSGKFDIVKEKEYIYLDTKQITSPIYSKRNLLYGYELPGRAKIILEKYDIIVSKLKGKIAFAMILDDVDNIICTNGFTLLRPIDYKSAIIIFANLFSIEFKIQHNHICTGSIMAGISENDLKNIYIDGNVDVSKYEKVINALMIINSEL